MRCGCFCSSSIDEPGWFTELVCHNANAVTHLLGPAPRFMAAWPHTSFGGRNHDFIILVSRTFGMSQNSASEWVTPHSFLFGIPSNSLSNSSCNFSWGLLYRSEMSMQTLKVHTWRIRLPVAQASALHRTGHDSRGCKTQTPSFRAHFGISRKMLSI